MENKGGTEYFVVRRGATALPNKVALNRSLSIQARGVLLVMCALPPGSPMGYRALMGQGMGETALRNALRELESAGHRWRFRFRKDGVVRTAVAVFDEPATPDEARASVEQAMGYAVEKCLSHPESEPAEHRAVDFQARSDSTVPCSTVARSTEAWSTAPRSDQAQLLLRSNSKDSSLRSESLPSIQGDEPVDNTAGVEGGGMAEPAARTDDPPGRDAGLPPRAASRPSDSDRDLVERCLPSSMLPLPDTGTSAVATRLLALIGGGWTPDELRAVLASQALPREVRSMTHLVLYRLNDVDPAGSLLGRKRRQREDRERLRDCVPGRMWPVLAPGVDELGEYVRGRVEAGVDPGTIEDAISRAFPYEGGVPNAQQMMLALQKADVRAGTHEFEGERRPGAAH